MLPGDTIPVVFQLGDGATNKFPRAWLFDSDNAALTGSPVDLDHVTEGRYEPALQNFIFPDTKFVKIIFKTWDNAARTVRSELHEDGIDIFTRDETLEDIVLNIENAVLNITTVSSPTRDKITGIVAEDGKPEGFTKEEELGGEITEDVAVGIVSEEEIKGEIDEGETI